MNTYEKMYRRWRSRLPHVRERQNEYDRAWRAKRKEELEAAKLLIAMAESPAIPPDVKADVLSLWREADGELEAPSEGPHPENHKNEE